MKIISTLNKKKTGHLFSYCCDLCFTWMVHFIQVLRLWLKLDDALTVFKLFLLMANISYRYLKKWSESPRRNSRLTGLSGYYIFYFPSVSSFTEKFLCLVLKFPILYCIAKRIYTAIYIQHKNRKVIKWTSGRYSYTNTIQKDKRNIPDPTKEK